MSVDSRDPPDPIPSPNEIIAGALENARQAAEAELREILQDEPDWKDVLRIVAIELDGRAFSEN